MRKHILALLIKEDGDLKWSILNTAPSDDRVTRKEMARLREQWQRTYFPTAQFNVVWIGSKGFHG